MRELKYFLATLVVLCTLTLTGIVAFRLAPETWAMIAGVVFGVVAALPMCAVVIMLLRRQPTAPPMQPMQPLATMPPPQIIMLHPGVPPVASDGRWTMGDGQWAQPGGPTRAQRQLPAAAGYAWQPPAQAAWEGEDWAEAEFADEGAEWAGEAYAAPARPAYRILGER